MASTFLQTQLVNLQGIANEYYRVISAILTRDGVQSYELDTGQGKQRVTAADLPALQAAYTGMISQIQTLENLVNGTGITHGRPHQ